MTGGDRGGAGFIHMTATQPDWRVPSSWHAYCRCGWTSGWIIGSQDDARRAGDAHLAEANGPAAAAVPDRAAPTEPALVITDRPMLTRLAEVLADYEDADWPILADLRALIDAPAAPTEGAGGPYLPFDQDRWLGDPPWKSDNPALVAWEAGHGHDVRLKCYPEFGCQAIENENDALRAERDALRDTMSAAVAETHREVDAPAYSDVVARTAWADGYTAACDALRAALTPPSPGEPR